MQSDEAPEFDPVASIEAIRFEYQMAVETAARVSPHSHDLDEFVRDIAVLESFLVHARSLHSFLSPQRLLDTDVKASDYVADFAEEPLDSETLKSINRRLQHLTVYRQSDHVEWKPMLILRPIADSMGRFIDELARRQPELAARLSDIQAETNELLSVETFSEVARSTSSTVVVIGYTTTDDEED